MVILGMPLLPLFSDRVWVRFFLVVSIPILTLKWLGINQSGQHGMFVSWFEMKSIRILNWVRHVITYLMWFVDIFLTQLVVTPVCCWRWTPRALFYVWGFNRVLDDAAAALLSVSSLIMKQFQISVSLYCLFISLRHMVSEHFYFLCLYFFSTSGDGMVSSSYI